MAIGKRLIGGMERSLFRGDGRYFQMKECRAKNLEEKKQVTKGVEKKDLKMVEKSLALYKNAMERTGHLPPEKRAKLLEEVEDRIYRNVERTYNPRAEKQSFAHQKLSEMTAKLNMERHRLKKK